MRKFLIVSLAVAMAFTTIPVIAQENSKSDDTVILYTNDVHTYIDGELSYDIVAALKMDLENQYENVLLVDAGDHIQGTAYGSMDKGKTIIELMNKTGYDVATLGNHEFDYDMEGCMNVIEWAQYPYISCNFYHEKDGERLENVLDEFTIFECGDEKIAFVGITTPETFTKTTPAYFQDDNGNYIYGISNGDDGELYKDIQDAIDAARTAGATTVIGLGHLGEGAADYSGTSESVISNIKGMDAFIDGHSHSIMEGKIVADSEGKDVVLTQTGEYFNTIGVMVIDSETGEIATKLLDAEDLTEITADSQVKEIKDKWLEEIDRQLGTVIGYAEVVLDNYDAEGNRLVRQEETNTGDFCADALYYLFDDMDMDVDIAVMNGGGIRNTAITGEITYKICKDIHTFGNVACLQTVTGQQVLDMLEWSTRNVGIQEDGSFLQVSGLMYKVDSSIPCTVTFDDKDVWTGGPLGAYRVYDVKVYNKETGKWDALNLNAKYNMAGYNYTLRDLGGGFAMFEDSEMVLDYVMEDYMVLAGYVKAFEDGIIKSDNAPLASKYPGFTVDYGTVNGSDRIRIDDDSVEASSLWIDGIRVTETNSDDVLGDGTLSFDFDTNTITLDRAYISGEEGHGIYAEDINLTICGEGFIKSNHGICVKNGDIIIQDAVLTVEADSEGICAEDGSIIVNCDKITANEYTPGVVGTTIKVSTDGKALNYGNKLSINDRLDVVKNSETEFELEPVTYIVTVEDMSYEMGIIVPVGMSANEIYCELFQIEDMSEIFTPEKEGYIFSGWYMDKDCTKKFDFDMKISENITIYAQWVEEAPPLGDDNNVALTIILFLLSDIALGLSLKQKMIKK